MRFEFWWMSLLRSGCWILCSFRLTPHTAYQTTGVRLIALLSAHFMSLRCYGTSSGYSSFLPCRPHQETNSQERQTTRHHDRPSQKVKQRQKRAYTSFQTAEQVMQEGVKISWANDERPPQRWEKRSNYYRPEHAQGIREQIKGRARSRQNQGDSSS